MALKTFKNLFFVDADNQQTNKQPPVAEQQKPTAQPVVNQPLLSVSLPNQPQQQNVVDTSKIVGTVNPDFMEKLCATLDSENIQGMDYQELKLSADKMEAAGITDENMRLNAAYIGLKAAEPTLTKTHILDSIDYYVNIIEREKTIGLEQLSEKRKTSVDDRRVSIQTTIDEIAKMNEQIEELKKKVIEKTQTINTTNNEILTAKRECDQKEADFLYTISVIVDKLKSDKERLETILTD